MRLKLLPQLSKIPQIHLDRRLSRRLNRRLHIFSAFPQHNLSTMPINMSEVTRGDVTVATSGAFVMVKTLC